MPLISSRLIGGRAAIAALLVCTVGALVGGSSPCRFRESEGCGTGVTAGANRSCCRRDGRQAGGSTIAAEPDGVAEVV